MEKALKVIHSCVNDRQWMAAWRYVELWGKQNRDQTAQYQKLHQVLRKKLQDLP